VNRCVMSSPTERSARRSPQQPRRCRWDGVSTHSSPNLDADRTRRTLVVAVQTSATAKFVADNGLIGNYPHVWTVLTAIRY
jgi:hypothetical protein